MDMRDWLSIILFIAIILLLADGVRKQRRARQKIRMKIDRNLPAAGSDDEYPSELPSGGARVKPRHADRGGMEYTDSERSDEEDEVYTRDQLDDLPDLEEDPDDEDDADEEETRYGQRATAFTDDDDYSDEEPAYEPGEDEEPYPVGDDYDDGEEPASRFDTDEDEEDEDYEEDDREYESDDDFDMEEDERREPTFSDFDDDLDDMHLTPDPDDVPARYRASERAAEKAAEKPLEAEAVEKEKPARASKPARRTARNSPLHALQNELPLGDDDDDEHGYDDDDGPAPVEEVLVINVMARPGEMFQGSEMLPLLKRHGLRLGDMSIFHRHADVSGNGPVMFSMANMVKPGTFDMASMTTFSTPGVSLFMQMPSQLAHMKSFDTMLEVANGLKTSLDGELKDDQRSVLTKQTIEHCRQRIRDFELRQLSRK